MMVSQFVARIFLISFFNVYKIDIKTAYKIFVRLLIFQKQSKCKEQGILIVWARIHDLFSRVSYEINTITIHFDLCEAFNLLDTSNVKKNKVYEYCGRTLLIPPPPVSYKMMYRNSLFVLLFEANNLLATAKSQFGDKTKTLVKAKLNS